MQWTDIHAMYGRFSTNARIFLVLMFKIFIFFSYFVSHRLEIEHYSFWLECAQAFMNEPNACSRSFYLARLSSSQPRYSELLGLVDCVDRKELSSKFSGRSECTCVKRRWMPSQPAIFRSNFQGCCCGWLRMHLRSTHFENAGTYYVSACTTWIFCVWNAFNVQIHMYESVIHSNRPEICTGRVFWCIGF